MIKRLVYNNTAFKMIDDYVYESSNSEVTFNEVKIDFTNYTLADIPYKYQEVKIMQSISESNILSGTILFRGYVDDIELADMKQKEEEREMTITLLSPLKMATKRSVTLIGTYDLETAIERILEPLTNDGFIIKEMNGISGQITTNFVLETIETCMNSIGYKRSIFWYIDEQKRIFVNSIDYLFGLSPVKTIDEDIKETGLYDIKPTIENNDYANIINFKNIRLIYSETDYSSVNDGYPILNLNKIIEDGDTVTFNNPIIVDEDHLQTYIDEIKSENYEPLEAYCFNIIILNSDNTTYFNGYIGFATDSSGTAISSTFTTKGSITFSDDDGEEGTIVLQRDSFYSNLITGFKFNGDSDAQYIISFVRSNTALRYTTMRFMYSSEINKMAGIISETGQIEKTIDYNGSWTTLKQLIEYARSLMTQNSNEVSKVVLNYDSNPNLKIGNIVAINASSYYIEGNFAVTGIKYNYTNELDEEWQITLKKSDLVSAYIDLFRPAQTDTSEESTESVILSEFIEESFNETHTLLAEGDEDYLISEQTAKKLALEAYGVYGDDDYEATISDYTDYVYTILITDSRPATVATYTVNAQTREVILVE